VEPFRLKLPKPVFKGITFLACFDFQDGGILTHKSARIGSGNFVAISKETEELIRKVTIKNEFQCEIMRSGESHPFSQDLNPSVCMPEKKKMSNFKKPGTIEEDSETEEEEEKNDDEVTAKSVTKVVCIKA
jgi:hypothetical protein